MTAIYHTDLNDKGRACYSVLKLSRSEFNPDFWLDRLDRLTVEIFAKSLEMK